MHSISDLEETVADQETRLTAAEENIQGIKRKKVKKAQINQLLTSILFLIVGLQMTDVELDARVTALEETDGTDPANGKYCLS